ncbi:MAG: uroporphyrinogen-III C-methyltransferase [Thaumarchaeota archaeon]|nr:uroporphyrinogen-III C-methyltransferase [Nitrososphaerota archaeon]
MAGKSAKKKKGRGRVYLVGAGPGDPGLLTLGALDRIRRADVVIYDRLVSGAVLDLVPRKVVKRYGGKDPGSGGGKEEQAKLNELMVKEALSGKTVVRLKGGDPFLFSRGGEEAEFLRRHRVDFELVPGVSSALAVPAYAGIPLTHRDYSSSVMVVTGQEVDSKKKRLDWSKVAGAADVLVILMGASKVGEIATKLLRAGLPAETPVASVVWGTTKRQKTVLLTLGEAAAGRDIAMEIEAPSVIVVGMVASLAPRLRWRKPSEAAVRISSGYREAWMKKASEGAEAS